MQILSQKSGGLAVLFTHDGGAVCFDAAWWL